MNANIKLAWFEDVDATVNAYQDDIERIIRKFYLKPEIVRYRNDEYSLQAVNEADLILADFDLGVGRKNSVQIIEAIRKREIVVDVLMYSSQYQKMLDEIQAVDPLMEGVFCAKRGDEAFWSKLESLIYRIDKRAQSVENLRGLVMEYTSIFDRDITSLIKKFCNNEDIKLVVLNYINGDLANSQCEQTYKRCEKKKDDCGEIICQQNTCCFKTKPIDNLDDIEKMEFYSKSRILNKIIAWLIKNRNILDEWIDFHKNFNAEIIIYRDSLAHEKSDEHRLYIRSTKQFIDINEKLFNQIRMNIAKYRQFFNDLSEIEL